MFNTFAHSAIDAIQTSKKTFINTFVKHEDTAAILHSFVEAQTEYTKAAADATFKVATDLATLVMSPAVFTGFFPCK